MKLRSILTAPWRLFKALGAAEHTYLWSGHVAVLPGDQWWEPGAINRHRRPEWFTARRLGEATKILADLKRFEDPHWTPLDERVYQGAVTGRFTGKHPVLAMGYNTKEKTMQFKIQHKRVPKIGAVISTKEEALLDALAGLGVDIALLRTRAREHIGGYTLVLCTPEQFTKFIITRYSRGGENWIAELDPQMDPTGEASANKNAWQQANKVWFVVDVSTGKQIERGVKQEDDKPVNVYEEYVEAFRAAKCETVAFHPPKGEVNEIRDAVLEEVASEFDHRARQNLSSRMASNPSNKHLVSKMIERNRNEAKFFRSLKGGISLQEVRRRQKVDWYRTRTGAASKFSIVLDGKRRVVVYFVDATPRNVIKLDCEHTYLYAEDPRLDWDTAKPGIQS